MPFHQRGPTDRRPQHTKHGWSPRRCAIETLESRRLLSVVPLSSPLLHGPLPQYSDPTKTILPPGSPPSAWLGPIGSPASGKDAFTFAVTYRDDVAVRAASIDPSDIQVYGPNGFASRAARAEIDAGDDQRTLIARYTVAAPGGTWDQADNGRYRIELRPDAVTDIFGVAARDGTLGEFTVTLDSAPSPPLTSSSSGGSGSTLSNPGTPVPPIGLDVRNFGAIPNDGIDDTDAIQRAIDALPDGHGVPGYVPTGGVVYLPAGLYQTSRPLTMHSGITLRGDGPNSVIWNGSSDRTQSAILLNSPFVHRVNIGASVQNLTLHTQWTRGISIDPNMGGDVNDLRLANLRISSFGPAIDLRHQAVYFSHFEDIEVYNPGSTALHLGRINDGYGAVNLVRNFRVTGTARSGFVKETALVYINNHAYVEGMQLTTAGANILPLYLSSGMTINGLDIRVPPQDCPNGIAVHFDQLSYALIDRLSGVGTGRRLLLTKARDVQITEAHSDGTSERVSELALLDPSSYLRIANSAGGRLQPPAIKPIGTPRPAAPTPSRLIDARDFGVRASDGVDDSVALQRAIDSLRTAGSGGAVLDAIPDRTEAAKFHTSGAILQLPHGILNLSSPIKLPSGVWLRGHEGGTVLENPTLPGGRAVIELTSTDSTRSNVGAGVVDLMISTGPAAGIRSDATITGELLDLRIAGIRIIAGGPSIDLRNATVKHATIDRVVVYNPGSTALWLGKSDNSSAGNLVRSLRMMGTAQPNFAPEKALVVLHGQTRVEGGSIEELFTTVRPFYASGSLQMYGLWMEYPIQPDRVGFVLDNLRHSYIDSLLHVSPERRLYAINGSDVTFGHLNIDGYTVPLSDCVVVDLTSRLTLSTVHAQIDSGWLDHPRVNVRGAFNMRSDRFVETDAAFSANYVADPEMSDVSDTRYASWTVLWGDNLGSVAGTWTVETVQGHKRLKLTVLSNPNNRPISLRVRLNVPQSAIGRSGVGSWRIDTNREALVYTRYYGAQYQGRVRNSTTAVSKPGTLASGEELWIDLPQAQGTYYIWKVGMAAV